MPAEETTTEELVRTGDCDVCGGPVFKPRGRPGGPSRTCSPECATTYKRKAQRDYGRRVIERRRERYGAPQRFCERCGEPIPRERGGTAKFCSTEHRDATRAELAAATRARKQAAKAAKAAATGRPPKQYVRGTRNEEALEKERASRGRSFAKLDLEGRLSAIDRRSYDSMPHKRTLTPPPPPQPDPDPLPEPNVLPWEEASLSREVAG